MRWFKIMFFPITIGILTGLAIGFFLDFFVPMPLKNVIQASVVGSIGGVVAVVILEKKKKK